MIAIPAHRFWLSLAVLLVTTTSVPAASLPKTAVDRMQTIAGRMVINDRDLKRVYQDMHGYARFTPQGTDRQLDYIQKTYLQIDLARNQGYYLWRLLSIYDYLLESRKGDFLTLYGEELRRARVDCRQSIRLIELYAAFIDKETIRRSLKEAVGIIEANIYMYEEIETLVAPYLNEPPYPRRLQ
ncbi:MAG: hypothetical protein PVG78_15710 [Desulfobacterales bacterium]|jgi:hypothetical protein